MVKEIEIRTAIDDCERKITEQVKRRTNRDKGLIRTLQDEHARLTKQLASILKDNREQTKDAKDTSGEKYRLEQEQKEKDVRAHFEKKQELEKQRKVDLNIKQD